VRRAGAMVGACKRPPIRLRTIIGAGAKTVSPVPERLTLFADREHFTDRSGVFGPGVSARWGTLRSAGKPRRRFAGALFLRGHL
jgi:hypothetical protein